MELKLAFYIFFWATIGIGLFFFLLYSLEWKYFFNSRKKKNILADYQPKKLRRFAIVIPARNESITLKKLIESIQKQNYLGTIDIYLVADNCTDNRQTYNIGKEAGINVLERFNNVQKGGNFAIQHALRYIRDNNWLENYDCFCSFDADNLLDKNWVSEINKAYDYYGSDVVTSYRNSKNYADNWISSAYSIQFLKESTVHNKGRSSKQHSAYINGTGFSFTKEVLEQTKWWDFNSLSHDIEFTQWILLNKKKCNYSEDAIFYDEQPIKFKDSWKQRMRWSVGFKQVWNLYKKSLVKMMFKPKLKHFPVMMNILTLFPGIYTFIINILFYVITSVLMFLNYYYNYLTDTSAFAAFNLTQVIIYITTTPFFILLTIYLNLFIQGIIILKRNSKRINATKWQKCKSLFTYPLFMITYIPITFIALFKKSYSTAPIARKQ
ncbi:glycosyltransferase family 2 protein [Mycoplasmopsis alligatoris]|uniref:Glycosyltransferase, group 2 family protein n=1 Tax=Mycoplasmopsis alligatoris A21JP2 TaxID=747682 RepID=D4XW63_9BACT|nr:glycosyltransferase family 2 protein [Mycoplasmopsis alligatoris]EFF41433.1 glycosyltransferase, group 2 family protein [Mycoplasmopsis alligatoris A21JP2]